MQFATFEFYVMLSLIIFPQWKSGSFQIIMFQHIVCAGKREKERDCL